jgi:hypothetical protein
MVGFVGIVEVVAEDSSDFRISDRDRDRQKQRETERVGDAGNVEKWNNTSGKKYQKSQLQVAPTKAPNQQWPPSHAVPFLLLRYTFHCSHC